MSGSRIILIGTRLVAQLFLSAMLSGLGTGKNAMSLNLVSSAFKRDQPIPAAYTCDGDGMSPPLSWSGLPPATRSLALIVDDPDAPDPAAPQRTWVHWVVYNIPPDTSGLPQGEKAESLPAGAQEGVNDWQRTGYGAFCPRIGRHRYVHKLYALDTTLPELDHPTKAELEKAMQGHVLDETELTGVYQRTH